MEIPEISTAAMKPIYTGVDQEKNKPLVAPPRRAAEPIQQLSLLAQMVYTHDLEEFNFSMDQTSFANYKEDQSLALKARSQINIHSQQETYTFEFTFTAEALGLTNKDFERTGGKAIEFGFSIQQERVQVQHIETSRVVNTLRKPEEILEDLAKALQTILKDRGNKSISYILDEEARKALMGDPKVLHALSDLVMLMGLLNLMKNQNQPSNDYTIFVSGKGKPYLEYERYTNVLQEMVQIEFHLTILPPGSTVSSLKAQEALPVNQNNEQPLAASVDTV